MREQQRARTQSRGRSRSLAASMAAADHDDIEGLVGARHQALTSVFPTLSATSRSTPQGVSDANRAPGAPSVSRETAHASRYLPMQKSRKITSKISSTSMRPNR